MSDLLAGLRGRERIAEGAALLPGFAIAELAALYAAISAIAAAAPFRRMVTPGGHTMSVAMTNCGRAGWVADARGYRYTAADPLSGCRWPAMPEMLAALAGRAAAACGFEAFRPDACLINRYEPGARMSLHQDRNEQDMTAPIVSVSLGLPAVFLWGGATRAGRPRRLELLSGDVVVWGGVSRLRFHGIDRLKPGADPLCGAFRYNLTFRCAL